MTVYQEYCPQGRTNKVIDFSIPGDDRFPSPTRPCICGTENGIGRRDEAILIAYAQIFLGAREAGKSLLKIALAAPPTPRPHASAIRRIS